MPAFGGCLIQTVSAKKEIALYKRCLLRREGGDPAEGGGRASNWTTGKQTHKRKGRQGRRTQMTERHELVHNDDQVQETHMCQKIYRQRARNSSQDRWFAIQTAKVRGVGDAWQ